MKRILYVIALMICSVLLVRIIFLSNTLSVNNNEYLDSTEPSPEEIISDDIEEIIVYEMTEEDIEDEEFYDSLEYLAMCVEAEAGNQGYLGKVYVADCIINRFYSGDYKNFYEVIDEPNQFSCVANGSIYCTPSEETYEVVAKELEKQTNTEIKHFRTGYYHSFGTPSFKYLDHYFSK